MVVHDPDICRCYECSLRSWEAAERLAAEEMEERLRSNKPKVIVVKKVRTLGEMPPFLGVIHRHFEKARPPVANLKEAKLVAPTDLLEHVFPPDSLRDIDSIEILYHK